MRDWKRATRLVASAAVALNLTVVLAVAATVTLTVSILLSQQAIAGEIQRRAVFSPTLGREFPYLVYMPDSVKAAAGGAARVALPVLYLLHGAGGDEGSWASSGHIKETADRLIAQGKIPPVLIVMPGCRGCWWIDGYRDKAETAFWRDLDPHIQKTFDVVEGREGRFVAGLSAGGFGAVHMAIKFPERFAAAAALSPAIYADKPPMISAARFQHAFRLPGGAFDLTMWKARNYTSHIDRYFAQPNRVPFYIASGDGDKYGCAFESVLLFKQLFEHQPEQVELRIVDGTHSWEVWSSTIVDAMTYMLKRAPRQPVEMASRKPLIGKPVNASMVGLP